jgi:hypothetical protein
MEHQEHQDQVDHQEVAGLMEHQDQVDSGKYRNIRKWYLRIIGKWEHQEVQVKNWCCGTSGK